MKWPFFPDGLLCCISLQHRKKSAKKFLVCNITYFRPKVMVLDKSLMAKKMFFYNNNITNL